jgi:hypothetical protein
MKKPTTKTTAETQIQTTPKKRKTTNPTPMQHEGTRLTVASGSSTLSYDELMGCQVLHDLGRVIARPDTGRGYSYVTVRDVLTMLGRINAAKRRVKGSGFKNPETARRAQLKSAEARQRKKLKKTD